MHFHLNFVFLLIDHHFFPSQNFLIKKSNTLKRVERGDFSADDKDEEPRTPMTPLPNPPKRTKGTTGTKMDVFSFETDAMMERKSGNTLLKLETLKVPMGFAQNHRTDVLKYWRTKKEDDEFKKLVALALGASASHMTVEKTFCVLQDILNDGNKECTDDYLEKHSFLQLNEVWVDGEDLRLLEGVLRDVAVAAEFYL